MTGMWAALDRAGGWSPLPPLSWLVEVPIEEVRVGDWVLVGGRTLPVLDMRAVHRKPGFAPGRCLFFRGGVSLRVGWGQSVRVRRGAVS